MRMEKSKAAERARGVGVISKAVTSGAPSADTEVLLRRRVVEARTGLSRSSLYDLIAAGEFPKPVPLGRRTVGWIEAEIADWQKRRIAERDQKTRLQR